jgi:hypothetical protein
VTILTAATSLSRLIITLATFSKLVVERVGYFGKAGSEFWAPVSVVGYAYNWEDIWASEYRVQARLLRCGRDGLRPRSYRASFQQDKKKVMLTTFLNTLATSGCLLMVYCAYSCLTYSS